FHEELKFPTGRWDTAKGERTIANVIDIDHPDWQRSNWDMDDPAVLRVRWVNGRPQYRYEFWGRGTPGMGPDGDAIFFSAPPDPQPYPSEVTSWIDDLDELARVIAEQNSGVEDFLNGPPPI